LPASPDAGWRGAEAVLVDGDAVRADRREIGRIAKIGGRLS
jgi:hypothetical protein